MNNHPASADLKTEAMRAALLAIAARHDNLLNPRAIVDDARNPLSPLHDQFEWDDERAGDAYRLAQAGALVRRIRLTIIRSDDGASRPITIKTTRAFQSRPSQRSSGGGYEEITSIMSDADKRAELLAQVVRELSAYRKRYAELNELSAVWQALDDATDAAAPAPKTKRGRQSAALRAG